jgi:glycosyltransferase involved in cell wall biosynthesis
MACARGSTVKIALIHYTYTPVIGGVEIVMAEHARFFTNHGHQVTVICDQGTSDDARIKVELLPDAADAAELARALEPSLANMDVVIIHNVATMPFHLGLTEALWNIAKRLTTVRFIAWIHDLVACNPDYALPSLTEWPWSTLTRAHERYQYVAVSELRRSQFVKLTNGQCAVIPNGLNPERMLGLTEPIAELAREYDLPAREIVLLHPTRLLKRKNVELGLRVTAALKAAGRSCAYIVTGAPDAQNPASREYAEGLQILRAQLELEDDALFLHEDMPIEGADMASLYMLADALFFPSRHEGFGLPVLEAALHRLPVFCSAIEPLNTLLTRGVTLFPLDAEPAQIALMIAARLGTNDAWQARNEVRRMYAWPAVYRNYLAPLLAQSDTLRTP